MDVRYTKHALEKFKVLEKHGARVSRHFVSQTVKKPELEDNVSRAPLKIAVGKIDDDHYLRIVYRQEGKTRIVITFYPVRKGRYEGEI